MVSCKVSPAVNGRIVVAENSPREANGDKTVLGAAAPLTYTAVDSNREIVVRMVYVIR